MTVNPRWTQVTIVPLGPALDNLVPASLAVQPACLDADDVHHRSHFGHLAVVGGDA